MEQDYRKVGQLDIGNYLQTVRKLRKNMEERFGIWYNQAIKTTMEDAGMGYLQGADRYQVILLPDTLDDYVGGDNEVRAIDAFIDSLDISLMGFKPIHRTS